MTINDQPAASSDFPPRPRPRRPRRRHGAARRVCRARAPPWLCREMAEMRDVRAKPRAIRVVTHVWKSPRVYLVSL